MSTLTIRNVDEETKYRLSVRASRNRRSMEAEVREILSESIKNDGWVSEWLNASKNINLKDFALPERSMPRKIKL
jgi:plasmid stability protein